MAKCRQWLDDLNPPNGFLKSVQQRGRDCLKSQDLPTKSLEEWRLIHLDRISNLLELPLATPQESLNHPASCDRWANAPTNGIRIVLDPIHNPLQSVTLPDGIRQLTPSEIQQTLGQNLDTWSLNKDWQIALNHAAISQVLALRIEGKKLPPLELICPASPQEFSPTRVLLILEENTQLDLLQVILGSHNSGQSHLVEIVLGQEATLKHGWIALGGGDAHLLGNIAVKQLPRSKYELTSVQNGWSLSRLEPRIVQVDGQASTTLKGLQLSSGKEQLATHSVVRFDGPEGFLDQVQKAAAGDKSHCIFNGVINVPRMAQNTNASQLSRNLLMSSLARIDTKPELEIIADNVKCTHGATVSQLQEDELFYLRSRGIESVQATSLLLQGYCQEIIKDLPVEAFRWEVLNQLLKSVVK